jgi:glucose-1-phosphate cytidylyltransferase
MFMKAVILAGGLGTRISEETINKPKPLIEIGGMPILWHIMKIYSANNINDFVICAGYKGHMLKEYFKNYFLHLSDVTFDMKNNEIEIHNQKVEPWKVTVIDTGKETMTGGRLKQAQKFINDETFCLTYGDGVADIRMDEVIKIHKNNKTIGTVTAVQPPGRFGSLKIRGNKVTSFTEKLPGDGNWMNGGYFMFEPAIFDYLKDDSTILEHEPLQEISKMGQLSTYIHNGFWQPLDTLRDKNYLEEIWQSGKVPWRIW